MPSPKSFSPSPLLVQSLLLLLLGVAACGGSSTSGTTPNDTDASTAADGAAPPADGATPTPDGATPSDSSVPDPNDGTPQRRTCTSSYGNALTPTHGRLDGFLVAIVPSTLHICSADSTHLHLQVLVNNAVYDVAVNLDGQSTERDLSIPDGAWSEGWHNPGSLDYVALGLHSASFTQATNEQTIENELANVNHISIFCTDYTDNTGCHDVHRRNGGNDGAIVTHPLASQAHLILFDFTTSTPF
jgi:hypothetical protein